MEERKIWNDRAKYTEVNENQQDRINQIRGIFSDIYDLIEKDLCKSGRETSLAMTKLEEAQFWAIKGITREAGEEDANN